jgi:hypothetical protein
MAQIAAVQSVRWTALASGVISKKLRQSPASFPLRCRFDVAGGRNWRKAYILAGCPGVRRAIRADIIGIGATYPTDKFEQPTD